MVHSTQLLGVMEANVGHGWIGIKFGMNWDGFGWILEMDLDGSYMQLSGLGWI